jgi:hypothetical protein
MWNTDSTTREHVVARLLPCAVLCVRRCVARPQIAHTLVGSVTIESAARAMETEEVLTIETEKKYGLQSYNDYPR